MRKKVALKLIILVLLVSTTFSFFGGILNTVNASSQGNSGSPRTFMSSNSIISYSTQNILQYPSVYDGYLWIMQSHSVGVGVPTLEKCSLTTNAVIQSLQLSSSIFEAFQPFVIDGYVLIPTIPVSEGGYAGLIVVNETTMKQITIIQPSHGYGFITVCYDNIHERLLIGQDDNSDPNYSIESVPLSQVTNVSAYRQSEIAFNPDGNANGNEMWPIFWNNIVYVVTTSPCNAQTSQIRTRLYSSTDLVTWTLVWEKLGQSVSPQCYFAGISATPSYLAVGVESGGSGNTTMKIEYLGNSSSTWSEFDTGIAKSPLGEDHPAVNGLDNDIFLFEASSRQGGSGSFPHTVYAFNCTSAQLTPLFTVSDNGNIGYNDRWIGIDPVNKNLYVADGINSRSPVGSAIIKIGWNLPLSQPYPWQVSITSNDTSAGTINLASGYYGSAPAALVATPNGGYQFLYWVTSGGVALSSNFSNTNMITTGTGAVEAYFAQLSPSGEQLSPIQIEDVQVPPVATQTGFIMPINLTLSNPDGVSETAFIEVDANSTLVNSSAVMLNAFQTKIIPCDFNTSVLTVGNYIYTVTVTSTNLTGSPVNTATGQTGVTYLGDLNGEFKVNFDDVTAFVADYIAYNTNGTYVPAVDYNQDGRINFNDLLLFVQYYIAYSQTIS